MRHYLRCTGCGNQLPLPTTSDPEPASLPDRTSWMVRCESCGQEFHFETDSGEASPDASPEQNLELELEMESGFQEKTEETTDLESVEKEEMQPVDWSVLGPPTARRRPAESSALRKIVPPLLGGLAAFPIATAIMWYGFGRDIGTTGPTVAKYVPWVVPEKLRRDSGSFSSREARAERSTPKRLPTVSKGADSVKETFEVPSNPLPRVAPGPLRNAGSASPASNLLAENEQESKATGQSGLTQPATAMASPPLSETIANLRKLQQEWSATPKEGQAEMVGKYCSEIKQLAQSSAALKGRSGLIWKKELRDLSREILSHSNLSTVIQFGATGKWRGVPPALPKEFVATVMKIGTGNQPDPNETWTLQEKWQYGDLEIPVEVLPDAWPESWTREADATAGSSNSQRDSCLLLGQILVAEQSVPQEGSRVATEAGPASLVLRVHAVLAP